MTCWTIVVAAGSGTRFGSPKQFAELGGQTVLARSVTTAAMASDGLIVVASAEYLERTRSEMADVAPDALVVVGGATRAASVRCGLAAVPAEAEVILVHDAARPFATAELFARVIDEVRAGADAVIPGVAVVDTIRDRRGSVVDREQLVAVQTPQGFRAQALRDAHATGADATDDASLVQAAGGAVVVVDGLSANTKITTPNDLVVARSIIGTEEAAMRVGQGFDVHRFSDDPDRPLVLGGVTFPGARGLIGHSDADVIAHACADGLLGALGLGDIGSWFPDDDVAYAGADSIELLRTVVEAVKRDGWRVANIDCSVVAEEPKLAPRREEMQQRLSAVVGAPVTVKGRRAEGLGALGRREGIACWAVALVERDQ